MYQGVSEQVMYAVKNVFLSCTKYFPLVVLRTRQGEVKNILRGGLSCGIRYRISCKNWLNIFSEPFEETLREGEEYSKDGPEKMLADLSCALRKID